jgi:epoxyqueuosine reductase QueG
MVWLATVLVNIELESGEIIDKNCPESCWLCIESCPVSALKNDTLEMEQGKYWDCAFHTNQGESFYFKCHKCRTMCPNCLGTNMY